MNEIFFMNGENAIKSFLESAIRLTFLIYLSFHFYIFIIKIQLSYKRFLGTVTMFVAFCLQTRRKFFFLFMFLHRFATLNWKSFKGVISMLWGQWISYYVFRPMWLLLCIKANVIILITLLVKLVLDKYCCRDIYGSVQYPYLITDDIVIFLWQSVRVYKIRRIWWQK